MSTTIPPPTEYDEVAQRARVEAALTYIDAAVQILIEAQEHEQMAGICWDSSLLEKLKQTAFFVKRIGEEVNGNIINIEVGD